MSTRAKPLRERSYAELRVYSAPRPSPESVACIPQLSLPRAATDPLPLLTGARSLARRAAGSAAVSDRLPRGALAWRGLIAPPKRPSGLGRPVVRRRRGIRLRVPRRPRLTSTLAVASVCESLRRALDPPHRFATFRKRHRPPRPRPDSERRCGSAQDQRSSCRRGEGCCRRAAVSAQHGAERTRAVGSSHRSEPRSTALGLLRQRLCILSAAIAHPHRAPAIPCARSRILGRLLVLLAAQATAGSHQVFQSSLDLEGEYTESSGPHE